MYQDQHSLESLGTARIILRHSIDYTDYLYDVLGREFILAEPIEFRGVDRLRVKFVSEKKASGERGGPFIEMYVEYNPAMGLYTVSGKYWSFDGAEEPAYESSPRSGFDDEMLADPARMFDWLTAVTTGGMQVPIAMESVQEALEALHTLAGKMTVVLTEEMDGVCMMQLEPEYRVSRDYFVSGTHFGGNGSRREFSQWMDSYVTPLQNAIQHTLDNLYGNGAFDVEIDADGFAYVSSNAPVLRQESRKMPTKRGFESEILRMAGVDGRVKYGDRTLSEKYKVDPDADKLVNQPAKKKSPPANKFQMMVKDSDNKAKFDQLVKKLKGQKGVKDPEALAAWIGLRVAGKKSHMNRGGKSQEESSMNASISADLEALRVRLEGMEEAKKAAKKATGAEFDPRKAIIYFDLSFEDYNYEEDKDSDDSDAQERAQEFLALGKGDESDAVMKAEGLAVKEIEEILKKSGVSIRLSNEGHSHDSLVLKFGVSNAEEAKKIASVVAKNMGGGDDAIYLDRYFVAQGFRVFPQGVNSRSYSLLVDEDEWLGEARNSMFARPGSALRAATKGNPRRNPCPTCKKPDRLTDKDVQLGYQCDACADAAEGTGWGESVEDDEDTLEEGGSKYKKLVAALKKKGADDPKALAAWIGRKKLGKDEFQRRAAAGRRKSKR